MKPYCRFCGCSELDACLVDGGLGLEPCAWTDATLTVCTACAPAALAETRVVTARELGGWDRAGRAMFHRGFVVGWFKVRSRNPYVSRMWARFWQAGKHAGVEARRVHVTHYGPIANRRRRAA